jgi:hypothetical protein
VPDVLAAGHIVANIPIAAAARIAAVAQPSHLSVGGLTRLPITFLLLVNSTTRTIKGGARTSFNTAGTTSSLHRCPHSLAIDPAASRPPRPHKISLPAAACLQDAAPHARFGNGVSCRTREHRHAQHPVPINTNVKSIRELIKAT